MNYLKKLDKLSDSTLVKQPSYGLRKINEVYKGKVNDFYLYKVINSGMIASSSIEQLNVAKGRLEGYSILFKISQIKKI